MGCLSLIKEKDFLGLPGISSAVGVFICRLPWVLIWLNMLNKSAFKLIKRTISVEERNFPFFMGYLNLYKLWAYIFIFYIWGRGTKRICHIKLAFIFQIKYPNFRERRTLYKSCVTSNSFVLPHAREFLGQKRKKVQLQTIMKNELAVFQREGIPSGCVSTTFNISS